MQKLLLSLLALSILLIPGLVRANDTSAKDAKATTISVQGMT